jgi:uncharacterized protein YbgA (DUF1722 family)/uncharacterized protein YbbK (DUF523 family)
MEGRLRLGISSCLLGEPVRYDGQHKLDHFLRDTLGAFVEWVPVCPEVESGLPVPREAMRLVGDPEHPRLVTARTAVDHTDRMLSWAARRVHELESQDLCGFVFKSGSPSSGMERVKVYSEKGMPRKIGVGLFAQAFRTHFPLLATEEEGRLHDPVLRENFIERVFTYWRWRETVRGGRTRGRLVDFHARHKLLVLAHSPKHYQAMGRLVAGAQGLTTEQCFDRYQESLVEALQLKATARKNANVLQHALGYFKKQLDADEKQELLEVIARYRLEQLPLIVPVTLVNHYVRKYAQPYLRQQTYLNPHPLELQLRNHV